MRAMLRSPGITSVALLSLALGIGANTAIFSLMDAVMLKSLPVKQPDRLVLFGDGLDCCESDAFPNTSLYSYPFYREMQKRNQVFSDVAAAYSGTDRVHGFVAGRTEAEPMNVQLVSGTYFPMLGVQPLMGRTISEEDDRTEGRHPVAVVSYGWWTRSLARDPSVLDKRLTIASTVYSIVGVAPPKTTRAWALDMDAICLTATSGLGLSVSRSKEKKDTAKRTPHRARGHSRRDWTGDRQLARTNLTDPAAANH